MNGSALSAAATMASLEIISISGTGASVCGATSLNLAYVKTLTKTGPTSMNKLMTVAKKESKPMVLHIRPTGRTTARS